MWSKSVFALVLVLISSISLAGRTETSRSIKTASRVPLVLYVVEKPQLTSKRPTLGESALISELSRRGYSVIPSFNLRDMAALCPPDVKGVWNADRRRLFRKRFQADLLWMAIVEYRLDFAPDTGRLSGGTVSVRARALSAATGATLWYGRLKTPQKIFGPSLQDAARDALAGIFRTMVADFDKTYRKRHPPGPTFPSAVRAFPPTAATAPGREKGTVRRTPPYRIGAESSRGPRGPYTGIIIDAEHLGVRPSFRTGIYSERGNPVLLPRDRRMIWADSVESARRRAGSSPLILRAYSTDGNRILLNEKDAGKLRREKYLLERAPVTIVVRPPRHRR